jgi:hypothetical protein
MHSTLEKEVARVVLQAPEETMQTGNQALNPNKGSTLPEGHSAIVAATCCIHERCSWASILASPQISRASWNTWSRRRVFAYSMKELPGYTEEVEPMFIAWKPEFAGKPIFEAPRRHSTF